MAPGHAFIGQLSLMDSRLAIGEVVNVGNTEEITIEDLAHRVQERTRSSSPIEYIPYDQAYEPGFEDMFRRVPCLDKLERLTGFRPTTSLPEIIDRVASYHVRKKQFVAVPREAASSIAAAKTALIRPRFARPPSPASGRRKGASLLPLAGEGVMRSMTDEGSLQTNDLSITSTCISFPGDRGRACRAR